MDVEGNHSKKKIECVTFKPKVENSIYPKESRKEDIINWSKKIYNVDFL